MKHRCPKFLELH